MATEPNFDILDPDGTIFTLTISVTDGYLGTVEDFLYVSIYWRNKDPVYSPNQYYITIPEKCGDIFYVSNTILTGYSIFDLTYLN